MCIAALVCVGSACTGCCCSSMKDCKVKYGPASRIPYIFLMFICCIFAICMTLFGEKILWENDLLDVKFQVCNTDSCVGNGSVYRTSFVLFIFFAIHVLMVSCVLSFHYLFLICKIMALLVFLTVSFWIPASFFEGYTEFARVASAFFLLIQIYVLISWAWDTNERIAIKINEAEKDDLSPDADDDGTVQSRTACMYKLLLVLVTIILNILCIIVWIFLFIWFTSGGDKCAFNSAMITVTIILVLIMTVLTPILNTGSIFTSAIVAFYCTFLCYSAMEASPDTECNEFAGDTSTAGMWVGIVVTAAAISYTGFSVSKNSVELSDGRMMDEINMDLETAPPKISEDGSADDDIKSSNYNDSEDETSEEKVDKKSEWYAAEKKANVIFHLCMCFSSIYVAMLYTAWGTNVGVQNGTAKARGWTSVYINLISLWVTVFVYLWTLLAPKICPGRFGIKEDED